MDMTEFEVQALELLEQILDALSTKDLTIIGLAP